MIHRQRRHHLKTYSRRRRCLIRTWLRWLTAANTATDELEQELHW